MSFARLRARQGDKTAARALLAPLYGSFGEGLETRDLAAARCLLGELA